MPRVLYSGLPQSHTAAAVMKCNAGDRATQQLNMRQGTHFWGYRAKWCCAPQPGVSLEGAGRHQWVVFFCGEVRKGYSRRCARPRLPRSGARKRTWWGRAATLQRPGSRGRSTPRGVRARCRFSTTGRPGRRSRGRWGAARATVIRVPASGHAAAIAGSDQWARRRPRAWRSKGKHSVPAQKQLSRARLWQSHSFNQRYSQRAWKAGMAPGGSVVYLGRMPSCGWEGAAKGGAVRKRARAPIGRQVSAYVRRTTDSARNEAARHRPPRSSAAVWTSGVHESARGPSPPSQRGSPRR